GRLARTVHEAFYVARSGRPGPVLIDLPKDIQFAPGPYIPPEAVVHRTYRPRTEPEAESVERAVDLIASAKRPIFYTGGGVINSGPEASRLLRELIDLTGFPATSTLMGLGAVPASSRHFLGMLGMHGTYEANLSMYHADVMINVGARFDDRVTGLLSEFSPGSRKIHIDIDASSINKNVRVELPIVGDCAATLRAILDVWKRRQPKIDRRSVSEWWQR